MRTVCLFCSWLNQGEEGFCTWPSRNEVPDHLGVQLGKFLGRVPSSRCLQRSTDWRAGIRAWAPGGPFGAVEECGGEGGNRREQRELEGDNKPSVQSGCRRRWVASPWLLLLFAGGRVEASLQERLLPFAVCECQWTLV